MWAACSCCSLGTCPMRADNGQAALPFQQPWRAALCSAAWLAASTKSLRRRVPSLSRGNVSSLCRPCVTSVPRQRVSSLCRQSAVAWDPSEPPSKPGASQPATIEAVAVQPQADATSSSPEPSHDGPCRCALWQDFRTACPCVPGSRCQLAAADGHQHMSRGLSLQRVQCQVWQPWTLNA